MKIRLRPSDADRWMSCTASPRLIADNHDRLLKDESKYATEGTLAHELAATMLTVGAADFDCARMERHVHGYVEWLTREARGMELLVEHAVPLWYMPSRTGIVDALMVSPDLIRVVDFKYGEGVAVFAQGNRQMSIYARSALALFPEVVHPDLPVELVIYQPRCSHGEKISRWQLTAAALTEFCEAIETTAQAIMANDGLVFAPHDDGACRWCPAAALCTARVAHLLGDSGADVGFAIAPEAFYDDSVPVEFPPPDLLPAPRLARILELRKDITRWLGDVEKYAVAALKDRRDELVPGWKLVQGNPGNRKWADEAAADKLLANHLPVNVRAPRKLVSPAAAEKELPPDLSPQFKARFEKLIVRPEGGPVLVPASDKRDSIFDGAMDDLEDLDAHELL
jgi:hypothetical protein